MRFYRPPGNFHEQYPWLVPFFFTKLVPSRPNKEITHRHQCVPDRRHTGGVSSSRPPCMAGRNHDNVAKRRPTASIQTYTQTHSDTDRRSSQWRCRLLGNGEETEQSLRISLSPAVSHLSTLCCNTACNAGIASAPRSPSQLYSVCWVVIHLCYKKHIISHRALLSRFQ